MQEQIRPHVVVVGAGFGGLSAAKALKGVAADVTLVDRRNHHLFQPLLYQVATAALSPNQIASPIRAIVRNQKNARVLLEEVIGVDVDRKEVILRDRAIGYDYLVLATGARHDYFGHDAWEKGAPGLKSLEDATGIRERILLAFERAELAQDPAERERLLTFVIVGGGPTGVEMAGAIAELARRALACDFRRIRCCDARVVLIEAGPRLLSAFSESLSAYAQRALEKRGVAMRLGTAVTDVSPGKVQFSGGEIAAETIVWAAGVRASPAAEWLGAKADKAGRALVRPDLTVEGAPGVYVVGDASRLVDDDGVVVPALAPAAKQQGAYVGRLIRARIEGRAAGAPFRYADYGLLSTVGRSAAAVEFGRLKLTGFIAWLFWSVVHIWFLIGFRNRLVLTLDWIWSWVTLERGARLITREIGTASREIPSAPRIRRAV